MFLKTKRLQVLHDIGFCHNDLKLDNILVGLNDPNIIYLIDFGIASKYIQADGSHIAYLKYKKFSGNFMFASLNNLSKLSESRRDDMQSLIYIMLYLLNNSRLPWSDFDKNPRTKQMSLDDLLIERL